MDLKGTSEDPLLRQSIEEAQSWIKQAAYAARTASRELRKSSDTDRSDALRAAASAMRRRKIDLLEANQQDLNEFVGSTSFKDRLTLDAPRIENIASSLEAIADQPDPLSGVKESWCRPNGLRIDTVSAPIGVIGMIYESRPNVGADAAGLCIKSGNSVILRGGSESRSTTVVLHQAICEGLSTIGLPVDAVQLVPSTNRSFVAAMLDASGQIDLLIPRGGKSLVERVQREARVPVLSHAEGICHTYIHERANLSQAINILANAKLRRTSVCGATETLLIDSSVVDQWLPKIAHEMSARGCAFVGDAKVCSIIADATLAADQDFRMEWQDAILSVAVVNGVTGAVEHIERYGSGHTDAIITEDESVARYFLAEVDSAVTVWNASTQFSDGGEFGFGGEIGISTGRIHARGPIGAAQLTTSRFNIIGTGQIRL